MKRTLFISNFKRVISVIAVVAITLFMISQISYLLEKKTTYQNYASFLTDDEEYDVVFLGSSHVRYGFYPMKLWNDYGITSYNLSSDANTMAVDYWVLKQSLRYHKPKTVVLDIYNFAPNAIIYSWELVHDSTGIYPISLDKIKMVNDLARNPEWTDGFGNLAGTRWELVCKLAEYHGRWASLEASDFFTNEYYVQKSEVRKGAKIRTYIEADQYDTRTGDPNAEYDDVARDYLLRIIDLCSANGISLVLINTGYNGNDAMALFAESIPEIAADNKLEYVDYTAMDLLDYACDFQTNTDNTHVNMSGAVKLTSHLGNFLIEKGFASDHRGEEGYEKWNDDYSKYKDYLLEVLSETDVFEEYIEMLYDSEYNAVIRIYDEEILEERNSKESLLNIGVEVDRITSGTEIDIEKTGTAIDPIHGFGHLQDIHYGSVEGDSAEGRAKVIVIDPVSGDIVDEKVF